MGSSPIKFIYFDIGGVFFSFQSSLARMAEVWSRPPKSFQEVFSKYDDRACRGDLSPKQLWSKYAEDLSLEHEPDFDFLEFWTDNFQKIYESHKLAGELSERYRIGTLTNVYPGAFEKTFEKGFIPRLEYETVVKSCDLGMVKPDHEIYRFAQERAGVRPEQIFFIDDSPRNVKGAEKAGWNAVLFEERRPRRSISKIKKLLRKMRRG